MTNYKELIENLRNAAKEWLNPGPTALREAADAIENQQTRITALMHQLAMARGERDAVTKRMIKLEQELGWVKEDT